MTRLCHCKRKLSESEILSTKNQPHDKMVLHRSFKDGRIDGDASAEARGRSFEHLFQKIGHQMSALQPVNVYYTCG